MEERKEIDGRFIPVESGGTRPFRWAMEVLHQTGLLPHCFTEAADVFVADLIWFLGRRGYRLRLGQTNVPSVV